MSKELHNELIKITDLMETCDPGDSFYKELSRNYRAISKQLYPHLYITKHRKPSRAFIKTLKQCCCLSTQLVITRTGQFAEISCVDCKAKGGKANSLSKARDNWNNSATVTIRFPKRLTP